MAFLIPMLSGAASAASLAYDVYNKFTGPANAVLDAAGTIGQGIDKVRGAVASGTEGFGSKRQQLQQKVLNGVLDLGTAYVYRKFAQKSKKGGKNSHLWKIARDAVLDPSMELINRQARTRIRDSVYDPNFIMRGINAAGDWDGQNFQFDPHKYDQYEDDNLDQQQKQRVRQQNALRQQHRLQNRQLERSRYQRIGNYVTENVPRLSTAQAPQFVKSHRQKQRKEQQDLIKAKQMQQMLLEQQKKQQQLIRQQQQNIMIQQQTQLQKQHQLDLQQQTVRNNKQVQAKPQHQLEHPQHKQSPPVKKTRKIKRKSLQKKTVKRQPKYVPIRNKRRNAAIKYAQMKKKRQ